MSGREFGRKRDKLPEVRKKTRNVEFHNFFVVPFTSRHILVGTETGPRAGRSEVPETARVRKITLFRPKISDPLSGSPNLLVNG